MAGFTTRLGLRKPGGGSSGLYDPDEVVDIDVINDNMDKIDANIGIVVVTSTTRPATPYLNQIVQETDTGLFVRWNGVTWVEIKSTSVRKTLVMTQTAIVAGGTNVGAVINVPTRTVEQRIMVRISGHVLLSAAGDAGIDVVVTGSGVTVVRNNQHRSYMSVGNQWTGYSQQFYITVPANIVATIQFKTESSVTAAVAVSVETERLEFGEY